MSIIHVVGAAVIHEGRCLVTRRAPGKQGAGEWEFPGGQIEAGETPEEALVRELREELGIDVVVHERLGQGRAARGSRVIVLDVYRATWWPRLPDAAIVLRDHDRLAWLAPVGFSTLTWSPADVPVLDAVCAALIEEGRA